MMYITILEKRVSISSYCAAVRKAKRHLNDSFRQTLTSEFGGTGQQVKREFLKGVHDRINSHDARRGRKTTQDAYYEMWRFAKKLNSHLIIRETDIPQCCKNEILKRFGHRVYMEGEI